MSSESGYSACGTAAPGYPAKRGALPPGSLARGRPAARRNLSLSETVFAWLHPAPFLEGAMEGAGFLEPQQAADVRDAQRRRAQLVDRRVSPQLVLDPLVARTFGVEAATQRCRRQVE